MATRKSALALRGKVMNWAFAFARAFAAPWKLPKFIRKLIANAKQRNLVLLAVVAWWLQAGGRIKLTRKGHIIIHQAWWVYDICTKMNFATNMLITQACYWPFVNNYLTPWKQVPNWDDNPKLAPAALLKLSPDCDIEGTGAKIMAASPQRWFEQTKPIPEVEIVRLFDSLPGATVEMMRGRAWRGRIVRCGRYLDWVDYFLIQPGRFLGLQWGKRYISHHTGDPLFSSWLGRVHFPLPSWGNVSMQTVVYRGKSCGTMVYDQQPWQDYFAVLDDGKKSGKITVLGIWTAREKSGGWFTLTENKNCHPT